MLEFKGLDMSPDFTVKSEKNFSQAQKHVDTEVVRLLEDYTPIAMKRFKNRGKMSKAHKIEKPGVIINTEPTARKEYYTNRGLSSKDGHNRGKFWLERMKADHKDDILKGIKK